MEGEWRGSGGGWRGNGRREEGFIITTSLVPRLSFSEGRREPGNIGGVKPWTFAARILAEPIRLQNENT